MSDGSANAEVEALRGQSDSRARLLELRRQIEAGRPPRVGDDVLYVSHGTPGGEFGRECRAAKVTEAGAWITVGGLAAAGGPAPADGDERILTQRYSLAACTLFVMNPTGLFLNGPIGYHSGRDQAGEFVGYPGGTWHWPDE